MSKKQISGKIIFPDNIFRPTSFEQDIERHIMLTLGDDYLSVIYALNFAARAGIQ